MTRTIVVSEELHRRLKMQALQRGVTLQDLVEGLLDRKRIIEDTEEENDGSDNRRASSNAEETRPDFRTHGSD